VGWFYPRKCPRPGADFNIEFSERREKETGYFFRGKVYILRIKFWLSNYIT
jgi:hypothetical protein